LILKTITFSSAEPPITARQRNQATSWTGQYFQKGKHSAGTGGKRSTTTRVSREGKSKNVRMLFHRRMIYTPEKIGCKRNQPIVKRI